MEGVGLERVTWPGKGKCDLWDGGGGCHEGRWLPCTRMGAMKRGESHATGLVPCSRTMLWATVRDPSGVATSSSAAPARSLWLTAQHSVPGHILHPQAWLGACLHPTPGQPRVPTSGIPWTADSLLTSAFLSGQTMSLHRQRPSHIALSPCAPAVSAPSSASTPRTSWGGKEGPQCFPWPVPSCPPALGSGFVSVGLLWS